MTSAEGGSGSTKVYCADSRAAALPRPHGRRASRWAQVAREQAIGSRETVGAIGEASAPVGWATLGRSGHEIRPCPVQNLFGVSAGCVAELYQAAIKASFFR